jgi:hypothetical protein
MTIGSILLGVALLIVVGLFVTRPIFAHDPQRRRRMSERKSLALQKEAILTEIRDLDFDYETGKVGDEEFRQQREAYVAEAAGLLKRIDVLDERHLEAEAPLVPDLQPAEDLLAAEDLPQASDLLPAAELPPAAATPPALEGQPEVAFDEIEAAIARRRAKDAPAAAAAPKKAAARKQAPTGGFCPQCGHPADAGDQFCAYCGHKLAQPQHA